MTMMGKSNPLGGAVCAYTPGTILFDGSNGDSATLQMKKGFYFIRGQGAGAGGGNCGLYGTGGGGGSGAGFEGNVYIADNQNDVNCYAGIAEEANRKDGEASYIGGLMNMGGGHIGGSDNGVAGAGGTLTISGNILVISSRVSSDGAIPATRPPAATAPKAAPTPYSPIPAPASPTPLLPNAAPPHPEPEEPADDSGTATAATANTAN